MIMPSKYLREDEALLGVSATILHLVENSESLSSLWESAKKINMIGTFERFILALDLLYLLGLVELHGSEIMRVRV